MALRGKNKLFPRSSISVALSHDPRSPHMVSAPQVRQLKKQLPKKGVVLALLARAPRDRTALALAAVLMGALGFGLRWDNNNHLAMAELDKIQAKIQSQAAAREVSAAARVSYSSCKEGGAARGGQRQLLGGTWGMQLVLKKRVIKCAIACVVKEFAFQCIWFF